MEDTNIASDDLYRAASTSDLQRVRSILSEGNYNINAQQASNGYTALYIAAAWGFQTEPGSSNFHYYEIAELLLEFGADVEIASSKGCTPLYIASSWGHTNIVKLLIKRGANINAINTDGRTALHIAAISEPHAKPIHITKNNKYHGYLLAKDYMNQVKDNPAVAEFLTSLDQDYQLLVDNPVNNPDEDVPDNIMGVVRFYNHFATVVELVEGGAQVNIQDQNLQTPLSNAAYSGHLPIVQFLVANGADLSILDKWGKTIVQRAREHSHVVAYLEEIQEA